MSSKPQPKKSPIEDYITVAERIEKFYERFPEGRIITQIVEHDPERGFILMRAEVYRSNADSQPVATGHAYELKSEGYVQRTSYIEVCETSSAGRALALAGFEVKRGIASREEVESARRVEDKVPDRYSNGPIAPTLADLVTSKQIVAIRAIAAAKGLNAESACLEKNKCRPEEMHRQAASDFIDYLKTINESGGEASEPDLREHIAEKSKRLALEIRKAGHPDFKDGVAIKMWLRSLAKQKWAIQINPDSINSADDLPDDLLAELPKELEAELKAWNEKQAAKSEDDVCF